MLVIYLTGGGFLSTFDCFKEAIASWNAGSVSAHVAHLADVIIRGFSWTCESVTLIFTPVMSSWWRLKGFESDTFLETSWIIRSRSGFSRRNHIQIKAVMTLQLWAPEKSLYPQLGACQQGKRTFKLHTILSQLYPSRSSWAPTDSRAICRNPYWRLLSDLMALERPGISPGRPI